MKLHVHPLRTPYRSGRFAIAGQTSGEAESILLRLHDPTDASVTGLGEAVPSKRVLDIDAAGIRAGLDALAPGLEKTVLDPDAAAPAVPAASAQRASLPSGPVACGLDGALLDAWAHKRGEPLWRALGLPRPRIPTTATISLGTADEMGAEARSLLEAGFDHLKVKLGGPTRLDSDRLSAVREAAPRARLRVDANEAWSLRDALAMVGPLARLEVELLEQPLSRTASREDHHALNRALEEHDIPHVLDEAVHTAADARRIADSRLAHGVNLKLQKAGGLRPGLELIEAARAGGLRVMVGCFIESWAGIALALQLAGRVDWADLDGAWLLAQQPVVPHEPLLTGGVLQGSEQAGLGVAAAVGSPLP